MPQTIIAKRQNYIVLNDLDLVTVEITGSVANLAIKNVGPANVWFSMDPERPVVPGGPYSTLLTAGEAYHESQFKIGNLTMTAQGGRASVCLNL